MSWELQSFDLRTEELLAEIDLDVLAAGAVERLIGGRPAVLAPAEGRVVAPLFDIEPDHWEQAMSTPINLGVLDPDWLTIAMVHLVSTVVGERPEDLEPAAYAISPEIAHGLLDRFSSDLRPPTGDLFLEFSVPWDELQSILQARR